MRYNDSVTIRSTANAAANGRIPKTKTDLHRIDYSRGHLVSHTSRMLLPDAQQRNDDVQRTYSLQQRRIHHHAKASNPNRVKSNPARKAATQAPVCVSAVIKAKSESNSIPPAGQQQEHRHHGVIRVPCAIRHSDWHSKDDGSR